MNKVRRIILLVVLCLCATFVTKAQDDNILFTIADKDTVRVSEFMQMYNRNSSNIKDSSTIDDYLDLYINYKLKLTQAKEIGLDKDSSTINQLKQYRESIIKPYVNDPKVMDSLTRQAYERMNVLVRASQILISIPNNVAPSDTMQYYQKAQMVYQKALKGEDFGRLADEYSDDPSANTQVGVANHGDLGYFSSLNMIYPFENACYSLIKAANTDKPYLTDSLTFCKTRFGYHIIKVTSVLATPFSSITLAHIFIDAKNHTEKEGSDLINEAYDKIKLLGFDSVVNLYSEDNYSKKQYGILSDQTPNIIPPEYIDMFLKYADSARTIPFKTRYGWHIVRYIKAKPPLDFNSVRYQITNRLSKDERAYMAIDNFAKQSKQYYNFKYDKQLLYSLDKVITDSVFSAVWQIPDTNTNKDLASLKDKVLFSMGDTTLTCLDFLNYVFESQSKTTPIHILSYIEKKFENYTNQCAIVYSCAHIEKRFPQIEKSLEEFKEGIMIFDLTDKEVWSASLSDTEGLQQYYNEHQSNYKYTQRADATVWIVYPTIDFNKAFKQIKKYKKKGKSNDEIKDILSEKKDGKTKYNVTYTWGRFEKGINSTVDTNIFAHITELTDKKLPYYIIDTTSIKNRRMIVVLNEILPVSIKPFEDCKGLVTSDYQSVLEERWINRLKQQYPVKVDYQTLERLKQ